MGRKVIRQGNNTLTITLPRDWTSKFGIEGGDELSVEQKGRSLILSSSKDTKAESCEITIENPEKFLRRFIDVLYRQGQDEIRVNFKDHKVMALIQKEIESLLGFEIVEQGKNYCLLKNVAVAMESEFDTVIRRIFLMLKSNFSDITTAAKAGSHEGLESISDSEKINNKLVNFCQRTINKKGHMENHKVTSTFYIVSQLEQVADELRDISLLLTKNSQPLSKETVLALQSAESIFNRIYNLFYRFDRESLIATTKEEKEAVSQCRSLIQKKRGSEVLVLHHVLSAIKTLHHITDMI